jgi:hypothetical protein
LTPSELVAVPPVMPTCIAGHPTTIHPRTLRLWGLALWISPSPVPSLLLKSVAASLHLAASLFCTTPVSLCQPAALVALVTVCFVQTDAAWLLASHGSGGHGTTYNFAVGSLGADDYKAEKGAPVAV